MSCQPITTTNTFSPPNSFSNPNSSTTAGAAVDDDESPISKAMSDDELEATPTSNNSRSPSPAPLSPATNELAVVPVSSNAPPPAARTPVFPAREDCWSEAATHTLIESWGSHYVELNRGNLRRQHWMEVADAVNALHGHTKKQYRTDIQCKNRIDTLKKKYKTEKARVSQSPGNYVSSWPFFNSLDSLIGDNFKPSSSPATIAPRRKTPPALPPPPSAVPVGPRSKRPVAIDDTVSRRNFSAMAAAAAAAATEDSDENEESETSSPPPAPAFSGGNKRKDVGAQLEGFRSLAEAIGKFSDIYKRVEEAKLRQMVDLEKQRMQFAMDLELQRMKVIMESQVQLQKLKRAKRNNSHAGVMTALFNCALMEDGILQQIAVSGLLGFSSLKNFLCFLRQSRELETGKPTSLG
nr:trihelix transcription factor ASIL2-like [Ipomoea batatas]